MGRPAEGCPWGWSVCRRFHGESATIDRIAGPIEAAMRSGPVHHSPARIDTADRPTAGPGLPSAARNRFTDDANHGPARRIRARNAWMDQSNTVVRLCGGGQPLITARS